MERAGPPLQIAVIGGGIAGLTAAYRLAQSDRCRVTVYEAAAELGGLAAGFRGRPTWDWPLEKFYHHLFTNDRAILDLVAELGIRHRVTVHRPTTAMHYRGTNYPFDSPLRVLRFPHLPLVDKLRMGLVLAYLRYHPRPPWQRFDRMVAHQWLERWMGPRAYRTLWQPMLEGKFGPHSQEVNLAWFWARIFKRTPRLAYFQGGFQTFIDALAQAVRQRGVAIHTGTPVTSIRPLADQGFQLRLRDQEERRYQMVLSTVSPEWMQRLAPDLPEPYLARLRSLRSMGAVVLTVALDRPLLQDGAYWVNVPKAEGLPFLALVEHTHMIDPAHYGGDHLLYLGDYLDPDHRYFQMSTEELLEEFLPALARFNPAFHRDWVTGAWLHRARYAQPVPVPGYLERIPDLRTPLPGLYYASMSQVYPWDRGTNYAVEMGQRVAQAMLEEMEAGRGAAPEPP